MIPLIVTGAALTGYMTVRGQQIAAQHAIASSQAAQAASTSQATPAGARNAAPLIIGPQDAQSAIAQTGTSLASQAASAVAYSPVPVAPTVIVTNTAQPMAGSTNPSGLAIGPSSVSATAVQTAPVTTVPAPQLAQPVDVGTPPLFEPRVVSSATPAVYAPVVDFHPTILTPTATCRGLIPGQ